MLNNFVKNFFSGNSSLNNETNPNTEQRPDENSVLIPIPREPGQLPWIYQQQGLRTLPSMFISNNVHGLGCELKDMNSDDPGKLKAMLTKILQKFEAIEHQHVKNGGTKLSDGFGVLAYHSPRFLFPGNITYPEFERVLHVIGKWTSDERAVTSLGNIKGVIDIANNLYKAWCDHDIHATNAHASQAMRDVLAGAESFIKGAGQKWLKQCKPRETPTLLYLMVDGIPAEKFTAKPSDRNGRLTLSYPGFEPNSWGDSRI